MRILHWNNTANQGMKIARIHRALGHTSDVAVKKQTYLEFDADYDLHLAGRGRLRTLLVLLRAFVRWAPRYDVFHFHECSLIPGGWDIPLLRLMGKTVIVHYHGSDIRRSADPARVAALGQTSRSGLSKVVNGTAQYMAREFANALLVSTPDLLLHVPTAVWVPQPTDLEYWRPSNSGAGAPSKPEVITIGHSPSTKAKKGTRFVVAAVERLKAEGYPIELVMAHDLPHDQVKPYVERADIFVDQLLVGWYGNAACEAMALKKPVCVYICPEAEAHLGACPVVNANPDNLAEKLRGLIEDPAERARLGERGRAYVEERHDVRKIATDLLALYERV
ncbi:MAG: glycosyltransferase family 4 protein [Kiritimatiellae bacterium]|nr:glycosyltransferase family 4 protein [Kiritimatiellia bacterium]